MGKWSTTLWKPSSHLFPHSPRFAPVESPSFTEFNGGFPATTREEVPLHAGGAVILLAAVLTGGRRGSCPSCQRTEWHTELLSCYIVLFECPKVVLKGLKGLHSIILMYFTSINPKRGVFSYLHFLCIFCIYRTIWVYHPWIQIWGFSKNGGASKIMVVSCYYHGESWGWMIWGYPCCDSLFCFIIMWLL